MSISFIATSGFLLIAGALLTKRKDLLLQKLSPRRNLVESVKREKSQPQQQGLLELPDLVSILWFLVSAGEPLHSALKLTVEKCNGYLAGEFSRLLQRVEHGGILQHELENLAAETKSDELRELSTKLAVSLANGTPLADQLAEFAASANASIRAQFLERAGKNETKMMIPLIFIILPVTVIFALYPSVTMLRNSFI